jgi:hypothetical protein
MNTELQSAEDHLPTKPGGEQKPVGKEQPAERSKRRRRYKLPASVRRRERKRIAKWRAEQRKFTPEQRQNKKEVDELLKIITESMKYWD